MTGTTIICTIQTDSYLLPTDAFALMAEESIALSIAEESKLTEGWRVKVSLGEQQWTADLREQMGPEEHDRLRWSLEDHALKSPFETQKCEQSLKELEEYRSKLFESLQFRKHLPEYDRKMRVVIDISEGKLDSGFQQISWEVLEDPSLWSEREDETCNIEVRRTYATKPIKDHKFFGSFDILYVVARPWQDRDTFIDHRLISRSLVQTLDKAGPSSVQVKLDIVRPGTWSALVDHLENSRVLNGRGYYDLVHFDMHGSVEEEGEQQSYFFEFDSASNPGIGEPISSTSVAKLLRQHRIRAAVLNTCESANARVGGSANLAKLFMKYGVRTVVAMSYKLSVTAAEIFFNAFYLTLFANDLQYTAAAMQGRKALKMDPKRRSRFGLSVPVHDWIVPVCYVDLHQPEGRMYPTKAGHSFISLPFKMGAYFRFSPEEKALIFVEDPETITETTHWQEISYVDKLGDLIGRDWEILHIEYQLMQRPNSILLLSGPPGVGKTALAARLLNWWLRTRFASYASYLSYESEDYAARLEGWITKNTKTPESERFGMPWIYIIDDIESDLLHTDDQENSTKLDQLVSLVTNVSSKYSKFILISRQHSTVFRNSKLVVRLQKLDYLISEFQLPGLSYTEAANFGATVLKAQDIHLDSASQPDIPYLERLYASVDRLPGGIKWLLSSAKSEPGFFRSRLRDLQHSEIKVDPWPRINELYTRLYDMKGNGKRFLAVCLLAYASFPTGCPSMRHWEQYISWLISREPGLFPPIEVNEHSIERQRDLIRRHEQLSDTDLDLGKEEDIKTYLRFILLWDDLLIVSHMLEQYGLILEAEGNIGRPTWIHPGLRHILRRIQTQHIAAHREPTDRAFAISMVRSYVQTQRRDHVKVDKDSRKRLSALYNEKNSLIRKDIRNYLRAVEIGQSLAGQSFDGHLALTFNHFAQFLEDVVTALDTNRYEIELGNLQEIGRSALSNLIATNTVLEADDAEGALALLLALHDIQGYQVNITEKLDLKKIALVAIKLCNELQLSGLAKRRLWLIKNWFTEEELQEAYRDELENAFGEYETARKNFKILGFTRPHEAIQLYEQFEAYKSAYSKYVSMMSSIQTLVPLNELAELEDRILRKNLQPSKAEDRPQIFAYARCLYHSNTSEQIERCYQIELLRLEGKFEETKDLVSEGLENALRTNNQADEYDFRRYFLETTDNALESVVTTHLENIDRLEKLRGVESHWFRCCPCWYATVQADIALRMKKPKKLLELSLEALSNAVFDCKVNIHVHRTFEYLEYASAFLFPSMRSFIGLCLMHKVKGLPPLGDFNECCQQLFQPCIESNIYLGGIVWKFNKASICEMADLMNLPADFVLKSFFILYMKAIGAAIQQSTAAGTELKEELSKEMENLEVEELVGLLKFQDRVTLETFTSWAAMQMENSEHERIAENELEELGLCGLHLANGTFAFTLEFDPAGEVTLQDTEGNAYPLATTVAIRPGLG